VGEGERREGEGVVDAADRGPPPPSHARGRLTPAAAAAVASRAREMAHTEEAPGECSASRADVDGRASAPAMVGAVRMRVDRAPHSRVYCPRPRNRACASQVMPSSPGP
jgi:hypothetical protein